MLGSSKIFIIGVRYTEVDEHIWSLLGKMKGSVTYFGLDGDKPEFEKHGKRWNKKKCIFIKANFEQSVQIIKRIHRSLKCKNAFVLTRVKADLTESEGS